MLAHTEKFVYSTKFNRVLRFVPEKRENGEVIAHSTRINIALFIIQKLNEGCRLSTIMGETMLLEPIDHIRSRIIM